MELFFKSDRKAVNPVLFKLSVVDRKKYFAFVEKHPYRNFLQYPSWADLKAEMRWASEFLGWFSEEGQMVGGAVVLYRKVPGLNKFLAYIPRGPMIDWFSSYPLKNWFQPLFRHLKQRHVFSVKMDPPLVRKKWSVKTIRQGIKDFQSHGLKNKRITDLMPDLIFNDVEFIQQELADMGWKQNFGQDSFDTVQPQFVFRLNLSGKSLDQIFSEFDPVWQKKIYQAEWEGVEVKVGNKEKVHEFYELIDSNAKQEQVQTRDLSYFEKMFDALEKEDNDRIRVYLAYQGEKLLSTSLLIGVNGHSWDLYSAKHGKSDHPASYLLRWKMIQDVYKRNDQIYDFRGVSTTLNDKDPNYELLRFKMGFNGEVCELMGEWDFPVIPMLHWAFDMYMKKR